MKSILFDLCLTKTDSERELQHVDAMVTIDYINIVISQYS